MARGGLRIGAGRPKKGELRTKAPLTKQKAEPIKRKCAQCGKTYINERRKYCSLECYKMASHEKQTSHPHICQRCGAKFNGGYNAKYCSKDCYINRNRRVTPDGITEKKCSACGEWKPLITEYFFRSKQSLDGFHGYCKLCDTKKTIAYSKTERGKKLKKLIRERNIATEKAYNKKMQPIRNEQERIKAKTNPSFSLNRRMRCLIWQGLKNNKSGRKWQELTGYSIDELRAHLEKQFKDGMTWEHFLSGNIHIDHKIPRAAFNYSHPEDIDFKKCWALKNLQPLWAIDNLSKGDKINEPFQPSLAMGI